MANQNGQHGGTENEHGYQDVRDQRDRERGRDDLRGFERDVRSAGSRPNTGDHADRPQGGGQWGQGGRDQFAERDRDPRGDHEYDRGYRFDRDRDWASNESRGSGNEGDANRDRTSYRGQSGSQAGGRYGQGTSYPSQQGGNRGQWGDFDRGGRSGGRDANHDRSSSGFGSESDRGGGWQGNNEGWNPPSRSFGGDQGGYGQRDQGYGGQGAGGQGGSGSQGSGQQGWNPQQSFGGSQGYAGSSQQRGQHSGKGPQGFQRSDERIKEMVHEALTDHEHIDATHINVEVKGGDVVLTGTVNSRNTKRLAEDIVERVTGVKDVQNQIRVQSQDKDQTLGQSSSTNTSHLAAGNDKTKKQPS